MGVIVGVGARGTDVREGVDVSILTPLQRCIPQVAIEGTIESVQLGKFYQDSFVRICDH